MLTHHSGKTLHFFITLVLIEMDQQELIDIDNNTETLIGNDIDIDDIVWMGPVDSVKDMASAAGVEQTAPFKELKHICCEALKE